MMIMKTNIQKFLKLSAIAFVLSASIMSCDDDSNDPQLTGESKTYTMSSVSDPSINGTIKFAERSDNATVVTIDLNGTTAGDFHPAHIHANSAAETGDIIIDLNAVDGTTGISETVVKNMDDGTSVSYEDLLDLDGYANVHLSAANLTTLIAQADIGQNELTTTSTTYTLDAVNASGITGSVTFKKRVSGTTLVIVDLDGASATGVYPAYIYENDVTAPGPITINLTNVNGATGLSLTSVAQLSGGTAITYDQLVAYDGHISISASPTDPAFVAQANIGANN
jgi:hypothetical protein